MNLLKKTIRVRYNGFIILIGIVVALILYFSYPVIIEKIYQKPQIQVSAIPQRINLTIEDNRTVSKRVELKFSDIVSLLTPRMEAPPGVDKDLMIVYDGTAKTKEYFVYLIANNSKHVFPQGSYEGIIRFYYKGIGPSDGVMNKAIPLDINVVKNAKEDERS